MDRIALTQLTTAYHLIDTFPNLEIVVTFCIRLDKIDLLKCLEKGIRVINTPNVLTDDVADAAIRLANMAILKTISESDRLVKSGSWMKDDFGLATREQCRYPHFWAVRFRFCNCCVDLVWNISISLMLH